MGLVARYCCSGAKVWLILKHEQLETLWYAWSTSLALLVCSMCYGISPQSGVVLACQVLCVSHAQIPAQVCVGASAAHHSIMSPSPEGSGGTLAGAAQCDPHLVQSCWGSLIPASRDFERYCLSLGTVCT